MNAKLLFDQESSCSEDTASSDRHNMKKAIRQIFRLFWISLIVPSTIRISYRDHPTHHRDKNTNMKTVITFIVISFLVVVSTMSAFNAASTASAVANKEHYHF
jgi:hypothetical protein